MLTSEPRRDPENIEQKILKRYASNSGDRVLDIGCGDGRLTWFYAQNASSVMGLDIEMEKVSRARLTLTETGAGNVSFMAAQGEKMPFANETFDLAIFSWSL